MIEKCRQIGKNSWNRWLYIICVLMLGLMDQRRGSATGDVQMMFGNLLGLVLAAMLIPSLDRKRFLCKLYALTIPVDLAFTVILCVLGSYFFNYQNVWISGVLNFTVWMMLWVYIISNRAELRIKDKLKEPFALALMVLLVLMQLSKHGGVLPAWFLMIFVGFYLLLDRDEIPEILNSMVNGIILWFCFQQIIAFGFRPYDYIRYRGMYSGETQNGMHYMYVFTALCLKYVILLKKECNKLSKTLCFVMITALFSFTLFSGTKSALLGEFVVLLMVAIIMLVTKVDIWYRLAGKAVLFAICFVVMVPAVYVTVRYLPTILHHPVWFEGEYEEGRSVCSFDNWDSPKYITFQQATESNIGRITTLFGLDYKEISNWVETHFGAIRAEAAELGEPGSSPENPYALTSEEYSGPDIARMTIWKWYAARLNLYGHAGGGFWYDKGTYFEQAHNMLLQMAYDYGIPAGILFLLICVYSLLSILRYHEWEDIMMRVFLLPVFVFGMFDMVLVYGEMSVSIMGIMFCFIAMRNRTKLL